MAQVARCIAPDPIGFGRSGKPDIDYRFRDQARYLDVFIDKVAPGKLVLVAQDWGTALALHFAARNPERVRGLAFMEFIRPMASFDDFHQTPQARAIFQKFRTPGEGEALILERNAFIEKVLPGSILRKLSEDEMNAYRAPFPTAQSRKPVWRFPNELPIAGEPSDVDAWMREAHAALAASDYPKLLFFGEPGALVSPAFAQDFAQRLHNCRLVNLGPGAHYLQEDHPEHIGCEVADLVREVQAR